MPRYDFRCPAGHITEEVAGFDQSTSLCACGAESAREQVPSRPARFNGFAIPPMRERKIPLSRFVEAQGEMVRAAERTGVQAPDVLGIAKRQAAAIAEAAPELVSGT